jgi:hypothetical protein
MNGTPGTTRGAQSTSFVAAERARLRQLAHALEGERHTKKALARQLADELLSYIAAEDQVLLPHAEGVLAAPAREVRRNHMVLRAAARNLRHGSESAVRALASLIEVHFAAVERLIVAPLRHHRGDQALENLWRTMRRARDEALRREVAA